MASILTGLPPSAHGSRLGLADRVEAERSGRGPERSPDVAPRSPLRRRLPDRGLGLQRPPDAAVRLWPGLRRLPLPDQAGAARLTCPPPTARASPSPSTPSPIAPSARSSSGSISWPYTSTNHRRRPSSSPRRRAPRSRWTPGSAGGSRSTARWRRRSTPTTTRWFSPTGWWASCSTPIAARFPDTLLIVTSDHGEEFFDHGGYEHARTLYNEVLWVPCVLWGPGVPRGEVAEVTDSLDLLPTIARRRRNLPPRPAGPCPLRSRGGRAGEGRELRRAARPRPRPALLADPRRDEADRQREQSHRVRDQWICTSTAWASRGRPSPPAPRSPSSASCDAGSTSTAAPPRPATASWSARPRSRPLDDADRERLRALGYLQ